MATLQRFKILATQCGVNTQSTSQSPSTSPLIQFRRGKSTTLKMLLSLRSPSRREQPLIHHHSLVTDFAKNSEIDNKDITRRKLRDLFVSSNSVEEEEVVKVEKGKTKEEVIAAMAANTRPVWFRSGKRIMQRAWRPRLGTIHE